ncbi:MAG: hypothetical protein EOP09_19450 [Proteobacteria bacterium]|nr:MAG: hypothetical protein EOP09_19450 [Pseudomonadota bacterium]
MEDFFPACTQGEVNRDSALMYLYSMHQTMYYFRQATPQANIVNAYTPALTEMMRLRANLSCAYQRIKPFLESSQPDIKLSAQAFTLAADRLWKARELGLKEMFHEVLSPVASGATEDNKLPDQLKKLTDESHELYQLAVERGQHASFPEQALAPLTGKDRDSLIHQLRQLYGAVLDDHDHDLHNQTAQMHYRFLKDDRNFSVQERAE